MQEIQTVLTIEEAYQELKRIVLDEECSIIQDVAPTRLEVEQGSWWGIQPESASKNIKFHLLRESKGTRVISSTYWPFLRGVTLLMAHFTCFFFLAVLVLVLSGFGLYSFFNNQLKPLFFDFLTYPASIQIDN